ncbi:PREDICTED: acriflavine sensitivity control protein acr-2-like [Ceratosolen solmsi marchali]|uniref:Acriflavine sensitivity control protein acr-2-like n=1 Tax=Ceratosolen solmsi marchali TaxID=326594 RepID=A0AAJ6YXR5_9HYME|nr:PREDICTED: acriflavine sensitivity control protein acr-2-like [Ceratosolen solmsi marchali]
MEPRVIGALAFLTIAGAAAPRTYDQRQEGRVNVQIDIKDVQILALVDSDTIDDYVNYDYPYDYADFTIKPRPTTGKPAANETSNGTSTTTEEETWSVWPTRPTASTTTPEASMTSVTSSSGPLDDESPPATILVSIEAESQQSPTTTTMSSELHEETRPKRPLEDAAEPRKRCPAGFLLKSGRCFKRRLSIISPRLAMMKLAPTLLRNSNASKSNLTTEGS